MNDVAQWQEGNDAFLAAALAWLRMRLERSAGTANPTAGSPEETERGWFGLRKRKTGEPKGTAVTDADVDKAAEAMAQAEATDPPPDLAMLSQRFPLPRFEREILLLGATDLDKAAEAMAQAEATDPPPALAILSQRFGLSRFEREILLLCAGMELDTRIAGLCARAQEDPARPYPTFALALTLFEEPSWDALSAERPLRYWRLLEINQPGATPLTTSALRADERVVNYLKGLNLLDDRLAPLLVPFDVGDNDQTALPPSQQAVVETIVNQLRRMRPGTRPPTIQLVGPDPVSKQWVASRVGAELGLQLSRLPAELLPSQAAELETLARLWQRESILLRVALYLDAFEGTEGQAEAQTPLYRFLARSNGLMFLDTREIRPGLGHNSLAFDVDKPTPAEQRAAWSEALGSAADDSPGRLAGQFNLNLSTIQQIAQTVLAETSAEPTAPPVHDRVWESCLIRTRPRLDRLAQRIDAKATWDELVVPAEPRALLRRIADQVGQRAKVYDAWGFRRTMNRGLGISALFAGESGTGKTMAAEVIANELRLDLYRIDLSAVVSKYIGETEKNLRRLFDAAEGGGVCLFFDEADALFGKRSEVKDSHDRYANIEINYLLQRMEAYRGLAILATNMKSALDQSLPAAAALRRELSFSGARGTPSDLGESLSCGDAEGGIEL